MLSPEDHELFKAYYHTETKYYIDRLERYLAGKTNSFNLKALLISYLYLCYRKMFKWAVVFFLISWIIGIIQSFFLSDLIFDSFDPNTAYNIEMIIDIIILVGIAAYTNRLYIEQSIRDIDKIKAKTEDHNQRVLLATKAGGVNWVVPLSLITLFMLLWAFLANT
ncbi:MAG: hypothetical protein Roseis2KO_52880 [Roseivirga sp.]